MVSAVERRLARVEEVGRFRARPPRRLWVYEAPVDMPDEAARSVAGVTSGDGDLVVRLNLFAGSEARLVHCMPMAA